MNEFKLKGKVVAVGVIEAKKVAGIDVEVIANNRTEIIPVIAFNKLSEVVAHYIKVGTSVEISGALRWNYRTKVVEPVAFKITEIKQMNTKSIKKVTENNKKSTEVKKKDTDFNKPVINGPVKKVDRFDGLVVNIYDNVSAAAEDMAVKKSDMKKAISNGTVLAGYRWSF